MDTPVAVGWQLGDDRLDLRHEFIVWQRWPADPSPGAKRTDFRLHKPKRLGIFLSCLRLLPRQRFTSLVWVGGRWNLVLLVHCFSDHCDLERHGISGNGLYPQRVMIEVHRLKQNDIFEVEGIFYASLSKNLGNHDACVTWEARSGARPVCVPKTQTRM